MSKTYGSCASDTDETNINEYRCVRCFGIFDVIVKNGKPTIDNCPFCNGDLVFLSEKGR